MKKHMKISILHWLNTLNQVYYNPLRDGLTEIRTNTL